MVPWGRCGPCPMPEEKTRLVRNSVVRKPGEFASEGVRQRINDAKEQKGVDEKGGVEVFKNEKKPTTVVQNLLP